MAEQSDKINLKATHCSYAQLQEANGDFETAIKHYQLADTHRCLSQPACGGAVGGTRQHFGMEH